MPVGRTLRISILLLVSSLSAKNALTDPVQKTLHHMVNFNKYLFTNIDTLKILVSAAPFYGMGRILDDSTHKCFYCKKHHKNINQVSCNLDTVVDVVIATEIGALMLLSMVAPQDQTRVVSHVFIASYPFALAYKDLIKAFPHRGACRPKNEFFPKNKCVYNGFPSGHMMEAAFMATLFGPLGFEYAFPLGLFTAFIAVESVVINRHTMSQVIAGAALGVIFGAAAQKTAQYAMGHKRNWDVVIDRSGKIALSYEYAF